MTELRASNFISATFSGYTGSQGPIGYTGSLGSQGVIGYTGSLGPQGPIGYTGSLGSQGPIGYTGSSANADQVDGYDVVVISALPGSPATNTIYFITG